MRDATKKFALLTEIYNNICSALHKHTDYARNFLVFEKKYGVERRTLGDHMKITVASRHIGSYIQF